MSVCDLDDATAQQLAKVEGAQAAKRTNGQVINPHGYYGWFQIGVSVNGHNHKEWTSWGGKNSEIGTASWDRQLEVARRGWAQKCAASGAQTSADVYCAWNVGEGTVKTLLAHPNDLLSSHPAALGLMIKQAYTVGATMTCAQALQSCRNYFNTGKSGTWISPHTDANTGKPVEVVPASDNQNGNNTQGGHFGGTIMLWLADNNISPAGIHWTTVYTPNCISRWFKMDCCCGLNGDDSFISPEGDVGMLNTNSDVPLLPEVMLGNKTCVFMPLTLS